MSSTDNRNDNRVHALLGTSALDADEVVLIWANPSSHRLLVDASITEIDTSVDTAIDNGAVTVGSTSTLVADANADRKSITLVNDSSESIYIALDEAAAMNSGVRLNSSGGEATIENYTGAVYAICASGSKNLTFIEL